MIYTVTFNPSLDYIISVDNFTGGTINRTKSERILPGGKGINVSIVLKNLRVENTAVGFSAGFTGDDIEQLLAEMGIAAEFIEVKEGLSRINVKLYSDMRTTIEETEINGQGPEISVADIDKLYAKLDGLTAGDVLVLAGSIPNTVPNHIYMDIMKHLQGSGIKVVVDATGELLKNVLPYHPFLVKPNHYELEELFGVSIDRKEDAVFYAKKLQKQGAVNVLVSMAGEGAVFVGEDGSVYQMEAPKGVVKNSVGAGDSMVAGFLAGYLAYGEYEKAFRMAVCAGSASAFSDALATETEVLSLFNKTGESEFGHASYYHP